MPIKLSPKQIEIAGHIAAGMNGREACATVGIDQTTLVRWKRQEEFKAYFEKLLLGFEHDSNESLRILRRRAIERIGELIESPHHLTALKAAEAVLSKSANLFKAGNIESDPPDLLMQALSEFDKFYV